MIKNNVTFPSPILANQRANSKPLTATIKPKNSWPEAAKKVSQDLIENFKAENKQVDSSRDFDSSVSKIVQSLIVQGVTEEANIIKSRAIAIFVALFPIQLATQLTTQLGTKQEDQITTPESRAITSSTFLATKFKATLNEVANVFSSPLLTSEMLIAEGQKILKLRHEDYLSSVKWMKHFTVGLSLPPIPCLESLGSHFADAITFEDIWQDAHNMSYQVLETTNGETHSGNFKDEQLHGIGQIEFPNGNSLIGTFYQGKIDGWGKMTYLNGDVYQGFFDNKNYPNLKGKMSFANGDTYDGHYTNGRPSGTGTLSCANGDIKIN